MHFKLIFNLCNRLHQQVLFVAVFEVLGLQALGTESVNLVALVNPTIFTVKKKT